MSLPFVGASEIVEAAAGKPSAHLLTPLPYCATRFVPFPLLASTIQHIKSAAYSIPTVGLLRSILNH